MWFLFLRGIVSPRLKNRFKRANFLFFLIFSVKFFFSFSDFRSAWELREFHSSSLPDRPSSFRTESDPNSASDCLGFSSCGVLISVFTAASVDFIYYFNCYPCISTLRLGLTPPPRTVWSVLVSVGLFLLVWIIKKSFSLSLLTIPPSPVRPHHTWSGVLTRMTKGRLAGAQGRDLWLPACWENHSQFADNCYEAAALSWGLF